MGGEDKEKHITKVSGNRGHVQNVFDTSMSRLLQDFSSAELFSNTPDVSKGANFCPDSDCETVVSSLKHLHIRRPVFTKQKKGRMCTIKKKNLPNNLNLAVAACGYQRPIVWPARLSCHSEKCHSKVLRPPRLPVKKKSTVDQERKTSINSCSSGAEKLFLGQDCAAIFGSASTVDYSSLSFSSLCEDAAQNSNTNSSQEQVYLSNTSKQTTVCPTKTLCKRQSSNSAPPAKFARTLVKDNESSTNQAVFLDYRNLGPSYSCSSSNDSAPKPSLAADRVMGSTLSVTLSTDQAAATAASASSPSSLETLATLSSALNTCDQLVSQNSPDNSIYPSSEEQRLEEANVNELASYFEDLLHIPRKMSIMAEMMYA